MDPKLILQAIVLLDTLLNRGPQLLAALKAAISSTDEEALKAELARLEASNDADFAAAKAALDRLINPPSA